jgi:hypothetical protein
MQSLSGIPIRESNLALTPPKQFRFPRTKKKRIRKKWAGRPENFKQFPTIYRMGKELIAHPQIVAQLRRDFAKAHAAAFPA